VSICYSNMQIFINKDYHKMTWMVKSSSTVFRFWMGMGKFLR